MAVRTCGSSRRTSTGGVCVRHEARMTGVDGGRPVLADGTVLEVSNVIWCTGFRQVFDWIRAADPGRARLAGGVPRGRRRGARAVLLRPVVPVRLRLDGLSGDRAGRRLRGPPDRRPVGPGHTQPLPRPARRPYADGRR